MLKPWWPGLCLAFFLGAMGCAPPGWGTSGKLALSLQTPEAGQRSLTPPVDWAPSRYEAALSGPDGETVAATAETPHLTVEHLSPGAWQVSVAAFNAGGLKILEGATEVTVGETAAASLTLKPLAGTGALTVRTGPATGGGAISGRLESLAGAVVGELSWEVSGSEAVGSLEAVASGYYELVLDWGGGQVRREVVVIVTGLETSATVAAPVEPDKSAGLALAVTVEDGVAPEVTVAGLERLACPVGPQALAAALVWNRPVVADDWAWSWYLDGTEVGQAAELTWAAGVPAGGRHLEVVGRRRDGSAAGSRSFELTAASPVGPTGWVALESLAAKNGVHGLAGVRRVTLAAGGDRLYTAAYDENAIGVFAVQPVTGLVSFQERLMAGAAVPLGGVADVAVSPDGAWLAAVARKDGVLSLWSLAAGGSPSLVGQSAAGLAEAAGVTAVAWSADGQRLYTVAATSGRLAWWSKAADGALSLAGSQAVGGDPATTDPESLALSTDGRWLAVASFGADRLDLFSLGPTGEPSPVQHFTDGQSGVDGLNGATSVAFAPDSRSLLVVGYYDSALVELGLVAEAWQVAWVWKNGLAGVSGLKLGREVVFSPDGQQVLVSATAEDRVTVFQRGADGRLAWLGPLDATPTGPVWDGPRSVAWSADGRLAWVGAAYSATLQTLFRPAAVATP